MAGYFRVQIKEHLQKKFKFYSFILIKYFLVNFLNKLKVPGQDNKRYPKDVRLDNRKVFRAPGPRTK